MIKTKTKGTRNKKEEFIDLSRTITAANKAKVTYLCQDCGSDLILDASYKIRNPFAGGSGYFVPPVGKHMMIH